jgi:hypothetical protein
LELFLAVIVTYKTEGPDEKVTVKEFVQDLSKREEAVRREDGMTSRTLMNNEEPSLPI